MASFKQAEDRGHGSDYYRFNRAAVRHLDLVTQHLESHGHYVLSDDDARNTLRVKLKHKKRGFLGAMSEDLHFFGATQYYARMSNTAVAHSIIKIDDGPLRSGSIVQIKTTDPKTGEYAYLGAWKTKALYYYKQDYDLDKQRWEIEKIDLSKDDIVRSGDRVRIKNLFFRGKPYITPYGYLAWFRWRYFLTVKGKATQWIMEWTQAQD